MKRCLCTALLPAFIGTGPAFASGTNFNVTTQRPLVPDANGNIGVGTASATSTFVVYGSQAGSAAFISANTTLDNTYHIIFVDSSSSPITITLPTAVGIRGRCYRVKDWKGQSGAKNITIITTSSQTIDGDTSRLLNIAYVEIGFCSDGANWTQF